MCEVLQSNKSLRGHLDPAGGTNGSGLLSPVKGGTDVSVSSALPSEKLEASELAMRNCSNIAQGFAERPLYAFAKGVFDIAFSSAALCVSLLPMALACVAIVLDDPHGSPLFLQKRVGKDGREFTMLKLRSMCVDAEARLEALKASNEKTGPVFKMADDPRITRVGRFIRKTSLAPVIIGTPGDGEPTKSLSHPVNYSLDLHKCERRPEPFLVAQAHYTSFQFLSFAVSGGLGAAQGRRRCARGAASLRGLRAVA